MFSSLKPFTSGGYREISSSSSSSSSTQTQSGRWEPHDGAEDGGAGGGGHSMIGSGSYNGLSRSGHPTRRNMTGTLLLAFGVLCGTVLMTASPSNLDLTVPEAETNALVERENVDSRSFPSIDDADADDDGYAAPSDDDDVDNDASSSSSASSSSASPEPNNSVDSGTKLKVNWQDVYAEFDIEGEIEKDAESTKAGEKLCADWCSYELLNMVACQRTGLERLKTAFQIENCEAALDPGHKKDVTAKIEKVSESSAFVFFRGAAAFFDYNMMCQDSNYTTHLSSMPRVYSNGDCHPENFGVMVQASNNIVKDSDQGDLVWGVNDFDQSFLTPFSWDLKRGATGFGLGIKDRGWPLSDVKTGIETFVKSYVDTIVDRKDCQYRDNERFQEGSEYVEKEAKLIDDLFQKSRKRETPKKTQKWLQEKMAVDLETKKFTLNKDRGIYPLEDSNIPEFQRSIDAWLYHGVGALAKYPNVNDFYKVLSVAEKKGSGTGSIGLKRYYILIKGRYKSPLGYIILEMKQEVNSVLEVFFRYSYTKSQEGKRAVDAEHSAYPYANLFFGWTTYGDDAFIIREKSRHQVGIDIREISKEEYFSYAKFSGRALAFYHTRVRCPDHECVLGARSAVDDEICHNIQQYIHAFGREAFVFVQSQFALNEAGRQNRAFELLNRYIRSLKARGESPLMMLFGNNTHGKCKP